MKIREDKSQQTKDDATLPPKLHLIAEFSRGAGLVCLLLLLLKLLFLRVKGVGTF